MKKVIIDGKEYFQMEDEDINRLPPMNYPKNLLTHCQVCKNEKIACTCMETGLNDR